LGEKRSKARRNEEWAICGEACRGGKPFFGGAKDLSSKGILKQQKKACFERGVGG